MFENTLHDDKKSSEEWNSKGIALGRAGKHDDAIICFNQAIKFNSKFTGAWSNKGYALYLLGKHEEAEKCFAKAKELGYKN